MGEAGGLRRATAKLPTGQLLAISVYWFGINAIWGGYELFGQKRIEGFVGTDLRGTVSGNLELLGALIAILVVPTVGTISDYAVTRWGPRKPFIAIGATLDLVFLFAIATSQSLLALAIFFLLLQFSSNFAQGPFQGYVPDLVPERQVGIASGLLGLMRTIGVISGAALVITGEATGDYATPLIAIGVIEFLLAMATVAFVREGPAPRERDGRSWLSVAREAWGLDALRERSFLFMTVTRLLFLMGPSVFVNISLYYVRDSLGQQGADVTTWVTLGTAALAVGTVLGTLPGAWLSNRTGRKPVIWGAAAVTGLALVIIALAPTPLIAVGGMLLVGVGSGAYLAVDWALMTETIPLSASGRYMGLANIANSLAGPLSIFIGGRVLDAVTRSSGLEAGPRAAVAVGIVFLVVASLTLIAVRPRVDPRLAPPDLAPGRAG
jgi:MFS family permease